MQNKNLYLSLGIVILLVGIAAFLAGRMFNSNIDPASGDDPSRRSNEFTFSANVSVTPALELPPVRPEVVGLFVEMKDNTIVVQVLSLDAGIAATLGDSSVDVSTAPKVEIVITSQTAIYRDVTPQNALPGTANASMQQSVEESTLEHLQSPSMISVWGNQSGDRIVASVLLYSNSSGNGKP